MLYLAIVNKIYVTVTFGWHYSAYANQRFACVRWACISFNKHGCKMYSFVFSGARDVDVVV